MGKNIYKRKEELLLKPKLQLSFVIWLCKRKKKKSNRTRLQNKCSFPSALGSPGSCVPSTCEAKCTQQSAVSHHITTH